MPSITRCRPDGA